MNKPSIVICNKGFEHRTFNHKSVLTILKLKKLSSKATLESTQDPRMGEEHMQPNTTGPLCESHKRYFTVVL